MIEYYADGFDVIAVPEDGPEHLHESCSSYEEAESLARELNAKMEWQEASVEPSGPEPGVADIAELAETPNPSVLDALSQEQIREDILADIVCLSAGQIADAIMEGKVRHVRVVS